MVKGSRRRRLPSITFSLSVCFETFTISTITIRHPIRLLSQLKSNARNLCLVTRLEFRTSPMFYVVGFEVCWRSIIRRESEPREKFIAGDLHRSTSGNIALSLLTSLSRHQACRYRQMQCNR
ncbi:uncharacterized protein K489DRAFT_263262 [Dissoconium aciculare CBS 342.82]|uniref:Uncharacterized protein n=1 Tax=Dissoconium aciculare CBS 342.82 TaxID=1314786 RepID=A0A6J3LZD9_9PEZI|nr:uncharacterized protein K489DRAFT_263262 [Dissoconium aciculare CBS 342.82]KAF1821023.1 hypothetical protein K489DRAFT_263262 [Dissoconium aciculare CBS 342.82]